MTRDLEPYTVIRNIGGRDMKRVLGLLICLSLVLGCAGTLGLAENAEPITFTAFLKDLNPNYENFESPVAQEITKRTGVTLQVEYPVGDLVQKLGLMIASDMYPDLLFVGGELNKFVEAEAVIDLEPLIDEYSPNIKKMYGDYLDRLRFSKDDPSIYTVGTYGVDEQKWEPSMGFEIQHRAIEAANYPDIKTLEDAEKVIADYVAANPTTNGQPTIGLSLIMDDWRWQSAVGNMAAFVSGTGDDGNWYVDPETYEACYRFTMDTHKEYFRWLNGMNAKGLLDPESFVQKYDHYAAKISSGRVVALNDQLWQFATPMQTLKANGEFDKCYGFYPAQLTEDQLCGDFIDKGFSGSWGIAISKSCKDPVRAIQFLDWMCSDEAQVLNNWGIEGVHYTLVDGKRTISAEEWQKRSTDPEYTKNTGVGMYLYPFPYYGRGAVDGNGELYNPTTVDTIIQNYSDVEKDLLTHYDAAMWRDLFPSAEELDRVDPWGYAWLITIPDDGEITITITKLLDVTKQYIAKCVLATPEGFDDMWDEFQAELAKAGVEKANATMTKLVQERVELWNQ